MSTSTLTKSVFIKSSPEHVWAFLTEPEKMATWFHKPNNPLTGDNDFEIMSTESGEKIMWGKVLKSVAPSTLRFEFELPQLQGTVTVVTIELTSVSGGTRLALEHVGLPQSEESFGLIQALDAGWDAHLKDLRSDAAV